MKTGFSIVSLVLTLSLYSLALAAPALTISPTSDSVFVVQGTDFQGVSALDITVAYDTSTLANPRVSQGNLLTGMSFMPNPGIPGAVKMAAIKIPGISGSGPVATISFDLKGTSPGKILALSGKVLDADGKDLQPRFQVINPTQSPATESAKTDSKEPSTDSSDTADAAAPTDSSEKVTTGRTAVMPGTVMQSAEAAPSDGKSAEEMDAALSLKEDKEMTAAHSRETSPAVEKRYTVLKGLIDQFRDFQGEKTPKALIALAKTDMGPASSQDPPISLSDGETRVKVTLKVDASDKAAPNFALEGASLVNMVKKGENTWLIEALPNKGVYQASLTVIDVQTITEYPLIVAPPVAVKITKSNAALSEKDFTLFLKERGTEKTPRYDLDGDGKRTYIDDYIYTLNYIVGLKGK